MPRKPIYRVINEPNTYAPKRFETTNSMKRRGRGDDIVLTKQGKLMDLFSGMSISIGRIIRRK